ncbi:hypothetical protein GCM10010109_24050 [Actinoplanes campanulatus]|nr:hypothetical protein GCM10010109_24050 [Actinoplanes campanulatus]
MDSRVGAAGLAGDVLGAAVAEDGVTGGVGPVEQAASSAAMPAAVIARKVLVFPIRAILAAPM